MERGNIGQECLTLGLDDADTIARIADRIAGLMEEAKRWVIVAMNGADSKSGKSYITSALVVVLAERNIPVTQSPEIALCRPDTQKVLAGDTEGKDRGVVIFDAEEDQGCMRTEDKLRFMRRVHDDDLTRASAGRFTRIDLWLATYHPDRPFRQPFVLGDIVIRNEGADQRRR